MSEPIEEKLTVDDVMFPFKRTVRACARCGRDHQDIVFLPFTRRPSAGYTHFGACPTNTEPILLSILPVPEPQVAP